MTKLEAENLKVGDFIYHKKNPDKLYVVEIGLPMKMLGRWLPAIVYKELLGHRKYVRGCHNMMNFVLVEEK